MRERGDGIYQYESIADVVRAKIDISVDFIIFASENLKVAHALSEVSLLLYFQIYISAHF